MYTRNTLPNLLAALADTPVVLLNGARQTGKTTLARAIDGKRSARTYLTLDDPTVHAAAVNDPGGFISGIDGPVVIDEVQRAPGLFPAIKASVDRRRTPGRFLLTGSANVLLLPRISESLAGRMEIITMHPLSQGEVLGRQERFVDVVFAGKMPALASGEKRPASLIERIVRGGFPEPLSRTATRRSAWFSSYLATILQRDVRDMANVEGLTDFPRLLQLIASRTSGALNFADLSRGLGMPQTTLKRYFAILEATFLISLIPAWSSNHGVRLTKMPKVVLADTGLACHTLGADTARLKSDGTLRGAMLETFVATELIKQVAWSDLKPRLFHFRTSTGREVDLVLEDASGRVVGIEVKSASSVKSEDFAGLRALREAAGSKFVRGLVLHDAGDSGQIIGFEKDLFAAPVSALWRG